MKALKSFRTGIYAKKCGLIFSLLFCVALAFAQDYSNYLNSARIKFEQGEYESAQKALKVYTQLTSATDIDLSAKISQCLDYQALAKQAELSGDYVMAKAYYQEILKQNPKDPKVGDTITKLTTLIRQQSSLATKPVSTEVQLSVGGKYNGYRICYLDATGKHGWIMITPICGRGTWYNCQSKSLSSAGWRMPSVDELKLIYQNRYKLGLNAIYWTCTKTKQVGNWAFYYTMDFGTGAVKSTDSYKTGIHGFYIKNF